MLCDFSENVHLFYTLANVYPILQYRIEHYTSKKVSVILLNGRNARKQQRLYGPDVVKETKMCVHTQ